jgi:NADPH-dependent 2,4-dienoyl-CoA reductase/sulfur reductase-like enzyme/rhodanese-related sulfurtransferase
VGRVIRKEQDLLVASPELFRDRFNIEVRLRHEVLAIDRGGKKITVREPDGGTNYTEAYDDLVLSPGSEPVIPDLPGVDLPGIFPIWTIPDTRRIVQWLEGRKARKAVVVGGGFIGLEMAENLHHRGLSVTIVEMADHVLPNLDTEMAAFVHEHLEGQGVALLLGNAVSALRSAADAGLVVELASGQTLPADIVLMGVGARPRLELARSARLPVGKHGGMKVDRNMRTEDPHIWAVGDAVEVRNLITGDADRVPLAGPANRQGRIAAEAIVRGDDARAVFRGAQATSVCGVLGMTVASTGLSEAALARVEKGIPYEKVHLHPDHRASYYPDAQTITLKMIFGVPDGRVLGAQAVGRSGVEKRIDVIATAIQHGATVHDLAEAELCYAPQYGSAKDPVNLAGMVASNVLDGWMPVEHWDRWTASDSVLLDVRTAGEYEKGHVPGAIHIPVDSLRHRLDELPTGRAIRTYCHVGQRSYVACRILAQNGYPVANLSGGYRMYLAYRRAGWLR